MKGIEAFCSLETVEEGRVAEIGFFLLCRSRSFYWAVKGYIAPHNHNLIAPVV